MPLDCGLLYSEYTVSTVRKGCIPSVSNMPRAANRDISQQTQIRRWFDRKKLLQLCQPELEILYNANSCVSSRLDSRVRMLRDRLRADLHTLGLGQGIRTRRTVVVHAVGRTARLGAVLTRHDAIAFELLLSTTQTRHDRPWALTGLGPVHEFCRGGVARNGNQDLCSSKTLRWFTDLRDLPRKY